MLVLQDAIPAFSIEVRLIHDAGYAVGERGDDPIGGSRDPAGICRTPKHVILVKIQRVLACHVVSNDGLMNMDGTFGCAGRAARKVE